MKLLTMKWHVIPKMLFAFLLISFAFSCQKLDPPPQPPTPVEESADIVYEWYKFISDLQQPVTPQPIVFVQNRAFAYIGVGLFESVQPGLKGASSFSNFLYQMPAMPAPDRTKAYLWSASANAALASMFKLFLGSLTVANRASIDAKELSIYNRLKLSATEDVLKRSEAFGRSIAMAIYNWSTSDNFSISSEGYVPPNEPWAWVPTPPNFPAPVGFNLQYSRPLLQYSLTAKAPPIPVPYSEDPNSLFYKAAKEVYDLGGQTTASPENKATANWWADAGGPGTGVPTPYHLLSIVTTVLEDQHAGLWKAAEVYAKTGIGLKDGPIITFRDKYQYNLLRPITYIRRHIDETWLSHLTTPPYPDYTSGLVCLYAPVIQVLIRQFGDVSVTDDAYDWRDLPERDFESLSQLLEEAAVSRVYAGIHYRFTQDVSIDMGKKLGNQISNINVLGAGYN